MNKYELTPMLETIGHSRLELRENIAAVRLELIENSLSQVTHSASPLRLREHARVPLPARYLDRFTSVPDAESRCPMSRRDDELPHASCPQKYS